jgi:RNA polymerase sigma factor (sigma-70 family)
MPSRQLNAVIHYLRRLGDEGPADAELLTRFAKQRDEEAFGLLLGRHGPLVMGVCRRLLRTEQDAEDVFQATFLVLARKAASIRKRQALSSWLYGVARRLALRARAGAARRQAREQPMVELPVYEPLAEFIWQDLRPVLDEEIASLPTKYRDAFVLCHLQDRTNEQAARELGCPLGTILSRLSRARGLLRERLGRRGVTLTMGLLVAMLAEHGRAAVPTAFVNPTIRAATSFAAGNGAVGAVSASAAALAEGVIQTMFLTRLVGAAILVILMCVVGTGVYSYQDAPTKTSERERRTGQGDKDSEERQPAKGADRKSREGEKPYEDANKEALRLANKLLQEEIEDEKVKLEGLVKKLERLQKSGINPSAEDPELAKLQRDNRRLQQELERLQSEVRLAEEDVRPYVQKLQNGAASVRQRWDRYSDKAKK